MWPDIRPRIRPEPELDSVMAAVLLCMLVMCIKLGKLRINCNVLMPVIVLLLLHIVLCIIYDCLNVS